MTMRLIAEIERGDFGEICDPAVIEQVRPIIRTAIKRGALDPEYASYDKKWRGSSLNYDIYDVGKKPLTILLQRRETTGDKYGFHPIKEYLLLKRVMGGKLVVEECPAKDQVVKLAKRVGDKPGEVLANVARIAARRAA